MTWLHRCTWLRLDLRNPSQRPSSWALTDLVTMRTVLKALEPIPYRLRTILFSNTRSTAPRKLNIPFRSLQGIGRMPIPRRLLRPGPIWFRKLLWAQPRRRRRPPRSFRQPPERRLEATVVSRQLHLRHIQRLGSASAQLPTSWTFCGTRTNIKNERKWRRIENWKVWTNFSFG